MTNFLIIGLPRSRTAWLSVALTYGPSFCYHEPLLGCATIKDLKKKFIETPFPIVGGADTGAVMFLAGILHEMPDTRIVIIDRDIKDCEQSMFDMGFESVDLSRVKQAIERAKQIPNVLIVNFDEISDPMVGIKIWEHCIGDSEFNAKRWQMLSKLNIEVDESQFFNELNDQRDSINSLEEETCG